MQVDLYVAAVPADIPAWVMQRLDASEQARALRLVQAVDRRAYVTAHGLLHLALDRAAIAPDKRRFETGAFGKPSPRRGGLSRSLQSVALPRVGGGGCFTVWRGGGIGSPGAVLPAAAQRLAWWVAKEALVKAAGLGLHQPLSDLTLPQVTGPGWYQATQLPLAFGPPGSAAWPWRLWHSDNFWLGLALKHGGGALPGVRLQRVAFTPDGPHFSPAMVLPETAL